MPVYNSAKTVLKSIDSFKKLAKILNVDCELYIIDDGSVDNTYLIAENVIKSHKNMHLIKNNENNGPGFSRNRAIKKIHHGYIGFLDSDDKILPKNYAKSFTSGSKMKADWITFNGWIENKGELNEKYDFARIVDNTKELGRKCVRGELDGSVIYSIYSAKLINEYNIRFPCGLYEDIPFNYSAMIFAKKRFISNEYSYIKVNRRGSIVNTISKKHIDGLLNSCVTVKRIFMNQSISNYNEFESDYIFGAYGYIAHALMDILKHDISSESKIELLDYLYEKKNECFELKDLPTRKETKKDLLTLHFINSYEKQKINKKLLLQELSQFYNQLFYRSNG